MSAVDLTPRNERLRLAWCPSARWPPDQLAYRSRLDLGGVARSTSVNTAPKPLTVAALFVPGSKKWTPILLVPSGVNSRSGLKVAKMCGYCPLMFANRTGVLVGLSVSALTWNLLFLDANTAPRGTVVLKKSRGNWFGADFSSGVPSH